MDRKRDGWIEREKYGQKERQVGRRRDRWIERETDGERRDRWRERETDGEKERQMERGDTDREKERQMERKREISLFTSRFASEMSKVSILSAALGFVTS